MSDRRGLRVCYVCLQATVEGQASHAHVHEIVGGLRTLGVEVDLFEPDAARVARGGLLTRLLEIARTQAAALRGFRGCDWVYLRHHFLGLPVVALAHLFGKRVAQEVNGPTEDVLIAYPAGKAFSWLIRWMSRAGLRLSDVVFPVTPGLAEWATEQGVARVVVVPNAANPDKFRPLEQGRSGPDYAVFVGELAAWQGVDTMLSATRQPMWPSELPLVVIGDGAMRRAVEAESRSNPLVHYEGRVPYAEVPTRLAAASVALSPQVDVLGRARYGVFPLKVFEAMAAGVPVIVSDLPGQGALVREVGAGLSFAPGNAERLATAVRELWEDPAARSRMGRNGRRAAESVHSWVERARCIAEALETDPERA